MQNITAPNGQSVMMYDTNDPTTVVPNTLINSYSVLTIPAFFRAMKFLSENLASFPRAIHKDGAGMDVAHPLDGILKCRPNPFQNSTTFWRTLFLHAAHVANGYARIDRGPNMRPVALRNMPPGDVLPFRFDADKGAGIQQWYYVRSTKEIIAGADMIHFAGLGIDGMVGADPIHMQADTFLRAKTLDKYQTRYLMKGTVLKGAIEVPGEMTKEQMEEFRLRLRTNFRGPEAEDDILFLTSGAKLNNATLSPQQSQLIEQATYSTKQIAQITGVHPWYLYDDRDGKYNGNPEQAGIDVVKYTFRPWIELAEDELSIKLLTEAEQEQGFRVRMDPSAILRGDSTTVTNTVVAQTNAGLRTPNEGRKVLELPPDPDPKSEKLRLLGDTTGKPATPAPDAAYAALRPIIDAACERIETKTVKAFENAKGKTGQERTIWANVFAEQQARYVAEAFEPINAALVKMEAVKLIDAAKLGERYAAQIRVRAAGRDPVTLAAIAKTNLMVGDHANH